MEGGDSESAKFTVPTLKAFLKAIVRVCLATSNNLLPMLQDAPKHFFFPTHLQSSGQPKNDTNTLFFSILHHLFPVNLANATVVANFTASQFQALFPFQYTV